jgi:hypothetical protein
MERMMVKAFLLGIVTGGAIVWRWRDGIQRYLDEGRARAVETLENAQKKTEEVIDRAKPQVQGAMKAAENVVRGETLSRRSGVGPGEDVGPIRPGAV